MTEEERPALVLEYNKKTKAVDVSWAETEDAKPSFVTSIPRAIQPSDSELLALGNELMDHILAYASALLEAIGEESDEDIEDEPELVHNHTGDLRPPGECPACDPVWERHP